MSWCHPTHAQRTKCACGQVHNLSRAVGDVVVACACGRTHSKIPGSAFKPGSKVIDGKISTGKRRGGNKGCPGDPM